MIVSIVVTINGTDPTTCIPTIEILSIKDKVLDYLHSQGYKIKTVRTPSYATVVIEVGS